MAWFYLIIAGLFEVVWAYFMKQSEGFSKFWPGIITIVTMLISFALLSWSMKSLPLGTAYAIWTRIGAVGAFVVGILWLGESANALRVISVLLVIAGLIGLKLSST
jgi:quaternary ammonium compound-resistance protein SugE